MTFIKTKSRRSRRSRKPKHSPIKRLIKSRSKPIHSPINQRSSQIPNITYVKEYKKNNTKIYIHFYIDGHKMTYFEGVRLLINSKKFRQM